MRAKIGELNRLLSGSARRSAAPLLLGNSFAALLTSIASAQPGLSVPKLQIVTYLALASSFKPSGVMRSVC